jgi:elongation factor G
MEVEVIALEGHLADVVQDLNLRRGMVTGINVSDGRCMVNCTAPLANLFGYPNTLRAISKGQGTYIFHFAHYQPVPTSPPDDEFPAAMAVRP